MQLTPEQTETIRQWVISGLSLSDIQKRITAELGLSMTYMQVRFLLDDLNLTLVDKTPAPAGQAGAAKPAQPATAAPAPQAKEKKGGALSGLKSLFGGKGEPEPEPEPEPEADEFPEEMSMDELAQRAGRVTVELDRVLRPGAMVSGTTTFSDGMTGQWWVDQMGRLGVAPAQKGYQPTQEDMMSFQEELQNVLRKKGF